MDGQDHRRPQKTHSESSAPGSSLAQRIVNFVEAISLAHNGSLLRGKKAPRLGSMVDVGCGDGRSTLQFAPYFRKITGVDKSRTQIAKAEQAIAKNPPVSKSSIKFRVASGERMHFADSSQDLVCFSRSFHWMELMSDALREAKRVLKPTGCLAMYCTSFPKIERQYYDEDQLMNGVAKAEYNRRANEMLDNFFRNACEMHPRSSLAVDDRYRRIYEAITVESAPRLGSKFIVIDDKDLAIHKRHVTLSEFKGMLETYAGYKCVMHALQSMNSDRNPLEDLLKDIKYLWSAEDLSDEEIFLNITWDVSLILSTRPVKMV